MTNIPEELKIRVHKMLDVHAVQADPGNRRASEYMRGLYNGLELAVAMMEGRAPQFDGEEVDTGDQPRLGCATTLELVKELKARIELGHGHPDYTSVGGPPDESNPAG